MTEIPATSARVNRVNERAADVAPLPLPGRGMTRPCGATWAKLGALRAAVTGVPSNVACCLSSAVSKVMAGLLTAGRVLYRIIIIATLL